MKNEEMMEDWARRSVKSEENEVKWWDLWRNWVESERVTDGGGVVAREGVLGRESGKWGRRKEKWKRRRKRRDGCRESDGRPSPPTEVLHNLPASGRRPAVVVAQKPHLEFFWVFDQHLLLLLLNNQEEGSGCLLKRCSLKVVSLTMHKC